MNGPKTPVLVCRLAVGAMILIAGLASAKPASANQGTYVVYSGNSQSPMPPDVDSINNNYCSFRSALIAVTHAVTYYNGCQELPNTSGTNTIILPPGTYTLTDLLPELYPGAGGTLTIQGSGFSQTFIDGSAAKSGFFGPLRFGLGTVQVNGLTLQNLQPYPTGQFNPMGASAVWVAPGATVNFYYVKFFNNGFSNFGNGTDIYNQGTVNLSNVEIYSNAGPTAFAGHIFNDGVGSLETPPFTGTAYLYADGLSLHNLKSEHGTIVNYGYMSLQNSTIGANFDAISGVFFTAGNGAADIYNSTFAYNSGAATINNLSSDYIGVEDSLVYGNGVGLKTCAGTGAVVSYGYNVFDTSSVCTTLNTGDTKTSDPVVDYGTYNGNNRSPNFHGGIGPVYLPKSTSSPLLNHADNAGTAYDGRGAFRDNTQPAVGAAQPYQAVLVVGNPSKLTAGDNAIKAAMGVVFGAQNVFYSIQADTWNGTVAGNGVIVIAGSASSKNIGTHFVKSTSGVVVLNQSVYAAMDMTTSTQNQGTVTANSMDDQYWDSSGYIDEQIGYIDGVTYGTQMYPSNEPVLTSSQQGFGWGTPTAAEFSFGMWVPPSSSNHYGFMSYGYNQPMFHSFSAPAVRWGLFANDACAAALSAAGKALVQQIIVAATNPRYW